MVVMAIDNIECAALNRGYAAHRCPQAVLPAVPIYPKTAKRRDPTIQLSLCRPFQLRLSAPRHLQLDVPAALANGLTFGIDYRNLNRRPKLVIPLL